MTKSVSVCILLITPFLYSLTFSASASEKINAQQIFKQKCGFCHGLDKKKLGLAVSAMSKDASVLNDIISNGKNRMPSFSKKLSSTEIEALVNYILTNQ